MVINHTALMIIIFGGCALVLIALVLFVICSCILAKRCDGDDNE